MIPSEWNRVIIKPIPKPGKDRQIPKNSRGINLISTVTKLYTGILNNRLMSFLEGNNKLNDEQSAYRKGRSCVDNLFVLTSLIRDRKRQKRDTFVCFFLDFSAAFDNIRHSLLLTKEEKYGINGNFHKYCVLPCTVRLILMDTSLMGCSIRQGDVVTPTIFCLFIDDLINEIKSLNYVMIDMEGVDSSILVFADDIALVASDMEKLQEVINKLEH